MLNSEKMVASIQNQDLIRADKYFSRALKEDGPEDLLDLGAYLESIGFLPQAKEIYLQLASDYPEVNLNLAQIATEDGHMEEAFLYLDAVPSTDPELQLNALIIMADLYQQEGLTDVAHDKLEQAQAISDDPIIRFGLAELEVEEGDFNAAIEHYASLDNREFLSELGISTYQRIGFCYANLGKFEAAIEFLEKAIEIEFDEATVFELAMILSEQEDYQRAIDYFKQIDTLNPDFDGYEYPYAQALHQEHKIDEALRVLQQGIAKNSFDSQLLLFASQLSYENHDPERAESYLLEAKELAEDTEEVALRLTNLYLEQERYEDILQFNADEVDNVLTKWNIARANYEEENEDQAFEIYQSLEKDLSQNPEFLQDYAYILREFAYYDKAREMAECYLNLVPDDPNMEAFINEL